jgi:predicted amidohydrolase
MPAARQVMHDAGEEIHVASWPGVSDMHQVASRHYAFEGRCFVIAVGGILRVRDLPPELPPAPEKSQDPDGLLYRGGSAVIAPDGRYLAGPVWDEEALVAADCDLGEIVRESLTLDVSAGGHYSRPDLFDLRFTPRTGGAPAPHAGA